MLRLPPVLITEPHDYIGLTYTGDNITEAEYRYGGASGKVVALLTITYDGNGNIVTVTRT